MPHKESNRNSIVLECSIPIDSEMFSKARDIIFEHMRGLTSVWANESIDLYHIGLAMYSLGLESCGRNQREADIEDGKDITAMQVRSWFYALNEEIGEAFFKVGYEARKKRESV